MGTYLVDQYGNAFTDTNPVPAKLIGPNGAVGQDAQRNLLISQGTQSLLNITAAAIIKGAPGRVVRISVVVAGTAAGSVNDVATTAGAAAANQIAAIPNAVGVIQLDWPCTAGIVVTPGTGQTIAVSFI